MQHQHLLTQMVDVVSLRPFHRNPRRGDVDKIAESLKVNGQFRAIVVNKGTFTGRELEVLAGNHTLAAALQLGWSEIAAHIVDVDDEQARRIVLADNRTSDVATFDERQLLDLLNESDDLLGTGYEVADRDALASLLADHDWSEEDAQAALDDSDEAAWPTIRATVNPGTYERFMRVPGEDEVARILELLQRAGY